ncbi:MAG: M1 family metallopeptidase [Planctomycetota bacterium]
MRTRTPSLPCLATLAIAAGCSTLNSEQDAWEMAPDTHSYARPHEVRSTHLDLRLTLDFDAHVARGSVEHTLARRAPAAPFVVDTDGLVIESVCDQDGRELAYRLGPQDDRWLGRALTVDLTADTTRVRIDYATSPDAEAMQWLDPAQTDGGEHPFLFTQGQAILTRSWIPLQDTPGVRVTWRAQVRAPQPLRAVMSADFREVRGEVTRFAMTRPVPSYLIALACGDLRARPVSGRCAVWAEPGVVDAATAELDDLERMVLACEQLFGPYRWGRYDVLFLPPSFPFGGMENPCMTFTTPTILAGDKSLVALIAHELAHSWSGNLVTNATWRDFWLNEGFTVYLEQRIMEHVYGRDRAAMEIALGMQGLRQELKQLPEPDQVLHIDLTGRNPDDGMTAVAYDKGAAFLRRLEEAFGRERMDEFLRAWFDEHSFRSVTTATFLAFLQQRLLDDAPAQAAQVDVAAWIRAAGLPEDASTPESARFAAVDAAVAALQAGATPASLDTAGWVTQQWLRLLSRLESPDAGQLAALDEAFGLTRSGNSEILCAWLVLATRNGYRAVDARAELFLLTVGRRKFLVPLYEAILASDGGEERAAAIYRRARPRYHAVSRRTLDALLSADA